MVAGTNCKVDIWRITQDTDDVVGGAIITGTLQYHNYPAFLMANREEQVILQQGLETDRTFGLTLVPGTLDVRERDEVQIVEPFDHPYHDCRFRVRSVRYSTHTPRDPRNYMLLQMSRSVRAHTRQ